MNLPELQQRIEDAANRALLESAEMLAIAEEIRAKGWDISTALEIFVFPPVSYLEEMYRLQCSPDRSRT